MSVEDIVRLAQEAHRKHWVSTSDESTGDKQAAAVTSTWQQAAQQLLGERVRVEVPVAPRLRDRIDIVDIADETAFEFKVSGKNPHHEFYKDIFKVIVYNAEHEPKLSCFVFVTEEYGAERLRKGLGKAVTDLGTKFGFTIRVEGV